MDNTGISTIGKKMPNLNLGTWLMPKETAEQVETVKHRTEIDHAFQSSSTSATWQWFEQAWDKAIISTQQQW